VIVKAVSEEEPARRPRLINELCKTLPEPATEPFLQLLLRDGLVTDLALLSFLMPYRTTLRLNGMCQLRNSTLKQLGYSCPSLKVLDLSNCAQVRNAVVRTVLQGCRHLTELLLNNCVKITDAAFDFDASVFVPLYGCLSLEVLSLQGCPQVTGSVVVSVRKQCANLKYLNLAQCKQIVAPEIMHVFECTQLKSLNLAYVEAVSDRSFELLPAVHLVQNSGVQVNLGLQELNLGRCSITDETLFRVAVLRNLEQLRLQWCSGITDAGIRAVVEHCPLLKVLDLKNCQITDEALQSVAARCRNLLSLNISWCTGVSDQGVVLVAELCTALEEVNMVWCSNITDASVQALANAPALKVCELAGCSNVTEDAIAALRQRHISVR
jgi:F-box/leucine-rich repeat protein 2/20